MQSTGADLKGAILLKSVHTWRGRKHRPQGYAPAVVASVDFSLRRTGA
jgi:hypothetical protein